MTVMKVRIGTLLSGSFHWLAIAVLTAMLVACLAPAVRADPITDDNVAAAMAAAKTPADHEALAAYFTSKAAAARESAEKHEQMLKELTGKPQQNLAMHCKAIIGAYQKQARDYTAMAEQETKLAKGSSKGT